MGLNLESEFNGSGHSCCMEYPQAISTCREGHSGFFDAWDHLPTSWKKKRKKKQRNFVTQIYTNKD